MITLKLNHYSDASKEILLHALGVAHAEILRNCKDGCVSCPAKIPCEDMTSCISYLSDIVHDINKKR